MIVVGPGAWAWRNRQDSHKWKVIGRFLAAIALYLVLAAIVFTGVRGLVFGTPSRSQSRGDALPAQIWTLDGIESAYSASDANKAVFMQFAAKQPELSGPALAPGTAAAPEVGGQPQVEIITLQEQGGTETQAYTINGHSMNLGFTKGPAGVIIVIRPDTSTQQVGNNAYAALPDGTQIGRVYFDPDGRPALGGVVGAGQVMLVHN